MDLGIQTKQAIVCASSKGLGKACAMALAREGVHLTINARNENSLEQTAAEIRHASGVCVDTVAGDIAAAETLNRLVAVCPEPDILINNNGGPLPGRFQ